MSDHIAPRIIPGAKPASMLDKAATDCLDSSEILAALDELRAMSPRWHLQYSAWRLGAYVFRAGHFDDPIGAGDTIEDALIAAREALASGRGS